MSTILPGTAPSRTRTLTRTIPSTTAMGTFRISNPRKRDTAVRLAERYFALASSEGDPRYVGYAQAALKPWWDLPAPPLDALVMRAILKQYSHDFSGAMQDLEAATREDANNARAWSWRAAIHMVQADYEKAQEDCLALQKLESELYAVGCVAYLDGTTGKAAAAHRCEVSRGVFLCGVF